jgi:glycosyltransferase involved in cell wall biosynthesis
VENVAVQPPQITRQEQVVLQRSESPRRTSAQRNPLDSPGEPHGGIRKHLDRKAAVIAQALDDALEVRANAALMRPVGERVAVDQDRCQSATGPRIFAYGSCLPMSQLAPGADARIRVGLFAHRLAQRQPTGIGRFIRELARAMGEVTADQDTIVLASTAEDEPATWVPNHIHTHVVPWPRRPVQISWCLGAGPRLERSLGDRDVVHLVQPFPPVKTTAPQVATVHDLFPFEHPEWYRRSEQWTYRRSMNLVLRRAVRIMVPSRYVAERLNDMLGVEPGRVDVVPLGVSGVFARVGEDEDVGACCARFGVVPGGFAVCVGAVSTRKNVIALVHAAAELSGDGIPLVLVGPDGHGAGAVEAEIARLDGQAPVVRTGYLPDTETAALVRAAAVLVHPTLGEGFGFVPLEAMAARTPVIAARVSSVPEVVGDAAVLVDEPTRPRAWADAVLEVVGSPERRSALVAAGERRAAAFSWQRTASRYLAIYQDAAAS